LEIYFLAFGICDIISLSIKEARFYMKKGFTLQELLITLGIIGIVAAVLAPAISNISPNKYKTRYMKAYNTLTRIVTDMIEDEDLFPNIYDYKGKLKSGFKSKSAVAVAPYNESSSIYYISNDPATNCKFDKIFASKLNINTSPEFCKDSNSGRSTFRTNDGTEWILLTGLANTYIAVDVDPDEENGKGIYSETNTNPHIFTFLVKSALSPSRTRSAKSFGLNVLKYLPGMMTSVSILSPNA
jgi:prepilin-type N-terminal cleavage/methylation domain-containing protein